MSDWPNTRRGIAGHIRRFFLMELSEFPGPGAGKAGVKAVRVGRYWESNIWGAMVAAIGAAGLIIVVGGLLLWTSQSWLGRLWGVGMILAGTVTLGALLGGNLAAAYPYAVEIKEKESVRFYAPFKQFCIPFQEVKRVKWSWLWAGWVVGLKQRRGLLPGFIIHVAWGRQGRELARAIESELGRKP
jgi:hypothetical protein